MIRNKAEIYGRTTGPTLYLHPGDTTVTYSGPDRKAQWVNAAGVVLATTILRDGIIIEGRISTDRIAR